MEEPIRSSPQHVESGSETRHGDGLQPVADDGAADKPPIPNASSTDKGIVLLNEKSVGARTLSYDSSQEYDINDVPAWAHTVPNEHVARLLGTNIQYIHPSPNR